MDEDAPAAGEDPGLEVTDQPILGGTATPLRPEVGQLVAAGSSCTATLISERHILTAGHCIDYSLNLRGGTFFVDVPGHGREAFPVERLVWLGHTKVSSTNPGAAAFDIAVGRLVNPVPARFARPAQISNRQPRKGDLLTIVGYAGTPTKKYLEFRKADNVIAERGDSGGPTFEGPLSANGPIVFVTSHFFGGPIITDRDIYGDPVRLRYEIQEMMNALDFRDGICYRAAHHYRGWGPARCQGWHAVENAQSMEAIHMWAARPDIRVCYSGITTQGTHAPEVCDGQMMGSAINHPRKVSLVNLRVRLASNPRGNTVQYVAHIRPNATQPPQLTPTAADNQWLVNRNGFPIEQLSIAIH